MGESSNGSSGNGKLKDILPQALDDLVSVNSLFTVAVFLGIAFASPNQHSLETHRPHCDPDEKMGKRLVVSEVVSFSSFLLSSLVAKSLKVYINIYYSNKKAQSTMDEAQFHPFKGLMFALSMLASIIGVLFLTISMSYVVEIKIGRLSCGVTETRAAVMALIILVPFGLIIYLSSMSAALAYSIRG
ncbi:hypothetical protein JCGZ_15086 [Jatropha curcas]|uniref:PGG domain-containing protein n=1 Tax=Jatropha curcas TaxID=180498 RepID=A0A067L9W6_JATCU|nr:uncharacterized protein LOC105644016 [Jatropha curcas]KDP45221.1 hypothetical protein JCGZ_15086 [Jatropha curcas]